MRLYPFRTRYIPLCHLTLAITVGACAGAASPSSPSVRESGGAEDQAEAERRHMLALHMGNYFWMVIEARDGLVAGGLGRARSRMRQLAALPYRSLVPSAWLPDMERMVNAAKQVADARSLVEATEAMATLAVSCGACHGKLHVGPLPAATALREPKQRAESVSERMLRHQWAADALWSGLTRPSDTDWRAGVEALIDAPLSPPSSADGGVVSQEQQSAMEDVREIGREAQDCVEPARRAKVYAKLLQSCSGCHGKYLLNPHPDSP